MDDLKTKIWAQLLSGKWLLTVTAGACLMIVTVTDCVLAMKNQKPFVDPAALLSIITAVVMAYFGRAPDKPADPQSQLVTAEAILPPKKQE